jgi:hypothetical protein
MREVEKEYLIGGSIFDLGGQIKRGEKELQALVDLRRQVCLCFRCICSFLLALSFLALYLQTREKQEERHISAKDMRRILQ